MVYCVSGGCSEMGIKWRITLNHLTSRHIRALTHQINVLFCSMKSNTRTNNQVTERIPKTFCLFSIADIKYVSNVSSFLFFLQESIT